MREPITWHRLTSCNHVDYRSPLLEQRSSHQSIFLFYHCHYYINIIRKCSVQIHIYIYIYLYFFFFVFLCSITPFSSKCIVSAAIKYVCFQSSRVDDWDKRAFFWAGGGDISIKQNKKSFCTFMSSFYESSQHSVHFLQYWPTGRGVYASLFTADCWESLMQGHGFNQRSLVWLAKIGMKKANPRLMDFPPPDEISTRR